MNRNAANFSRDSCRQVIQEFEGTGDYSHRFSLGPNTHEEKKNKGKERHQYHGHDLVNHGSQRC